MSKYILNINSRLPGLNDFIHAINRNRFVGAKLKKDTERLISWEIKTQLKDVVINKPVKIKFIWIEENKRRDLDNIYSAHKYILDSLVGMGVLPNDNQKWVTKITDECLIDKKSKVIVEIEEV